MKLPNAITTAIAVILFALIERFAGPEATQTAAELTLAVLAILAKAWQEYQARHQIRAQSAAQPGTRSTAQAASQPGTLRRILTQ
jgi:uncharacterized protein (DUF2267 family)